MTPEKLIVLATARGISLDLGRPKREIPKEHRNPPKRRSDGKGPSIPGVLSGAGTQTNDGSRPAWSASDLGQAAAGMPKNEWHALCWCIGFEEVSRIYLRDELLGKARSLGERQKWPECVFRSRDCSRCGFARNPHTYIEDLCALVLIEGAHPNTLRSEGSRAELFGMHERTWRRHLSGRYQDIYSQLMRWYGAGLGYLRTRLKKIDDSRNEARKTA